MYSKESLRRLVEVAVTTNRPGGCGCAKTRGWSESVGQRGRRNNTYLIQRLTRAVATRKHCGYSPSYRVIPPPFKQIISSGKQVASSIRGWGHDAIRSSWYENSNSGGYVPSINRQSSRSIILQTKLQIVQSTEDVIRRIWSLSISCSKRSCCALRCLALRRFALLCLALLCFTFPRCMPFCHFPSAWICAPLNP